MNETRDLIVASEVRGLRADLDSLIKRVYDFRRDESRSGIPADEVFSKIELEHILLDAQESLEDLAKSVDVEFERSKTAVPLCRCKVKDSSYDISRCKLHTIDHIYTVTCCGQPDGSHRHATSDEYDQMYPEVFDQRFTVDDITYRVDARSYRKGVGVTLTQLFRKKTDDADNDVGVCFDFPITIVKPLIDTLQGLLDLPER